MQGAATRGQLPRPLPDGLETTSRISAFVAQLSLDRTDEPGHITSRQRVGEHRVPHSRVEHWVGVAASDRLEQAELAACHRSGQLDEHEDLADAGGPHQLVLLVAEKLGPAGHVDRGDAPSR